VELVALNQVWLKKRRLFSDWLDSPLGRAYLGFELDALKDKTEHIFAEYALHIGFLPFTQGLAGPRIKRVVICQSKLDSTVPTNILSRTDKLAIASEEIDLVYLAHELEFCQNPHEVLREAYRVLRPEGNLLISGFCALSLWGLWRRLCAWPVAPCWAGNIVAQYRLSDWLALLGFDIITSNKFGALLPINKLKVLQKTANTMNTAGKIIPWLRAGFLIWAKKRVQTITPIMPSWRSNPEAEANAILQKN